MQAPPPEILDRPRERDDAGLGEPICVIDGCDTLAKLFLFRCRALGGRTAHPEKALGVWKSYS